MQNFSRFIFVIILIAASSGIAQNLVLPQLASSNSISGNNGKSIKTADDLSSQNLSEDKTKSSRRYSLAFKNKYIEQDNFDDTQKYFEPHSLVYSSKIVNNPLNSDNYELADGTYWRNESEINTSRLYPVLGTMLAVDLIAYNMQRIAWRQNKLSTFHSINWWVDTHGYQRMDKIGHFQDAYFVSDLTSKLYRWCGLSGESSIWYGAMTGWVWMLEIEISDGFFQKWGFSWLDLSANTLGSGFFVLQHYFPEILGGIHPKFSYHVSPAWKSHIYVVNPKAFIDDYEGMTFWFAINPYHYFPASWKNDYPKWLAPLGIAVGYGAADIAQSPQYGKPIWYFSLDLDLPKIPIGNDSGIFKFIKSELNFLKVPMPTVRITPGDVWYGLYF